MNVVEIKLSCRAETKVHKKNQPRDNHEIGINNKPVFYKRNLNHGIRTVEDLRFDLNNIDFLNYS